MRNERQVVAADEVTVGLLARKPPPLNAVVFEQMFFVPLRSFEGFPADRAQQFLVVVVHFYSFRFFHYAFLDSTRRLLLFLKIVAQNESFFVESRDDARAGRAGSELPDSVARRHVADVDIVIVDVGSLSLHERRIQIGFSFDFHVVSFSFVDSR